jgi:hypothetical protein
VETPGRSVKTETTVNSLQKCGISSAFDGTKNMQCIKAVTVMAQTATFPNISSNESDKELLRF